MSQPFRKTLLLSVGVLLLGGCEQLYNGSLTFMDRQQVQAYQQFKQDQAHEVTAAGAPDPDTAADLADNPAAPPAPEFAHQPPAAPPPAPTVEAEPIRMTSSQPTRHRVGGLGLFGDIEPAADSRTSPLDSPGDITQMTFTAEGADFDPDADPTGRYIVYASTRHRTTADLYIKRTDGSAVTQLTADPADEVMPTFSPDGQWVAFASNRTGSFDIYVMPAAGGKPKQLTNDGAINLHPSFSPDGAKIVYSSLGSASGQWEMVIIDVANPSTKRVIGNGLFPTWSPTQDSIVFQRSRQRGTRWFSVWTMDLVDGEPTPPTEIAVSANAAVITPDWSPDGRQVVFCTVIEPEADVNSSPTRADLWITAADGTGRVKLTSGDYANLQPSWTADGAILFVSDRAGGGVENIWALHPGKALDLAQPAGTRSPTSVMVPTD